MDGTSVHLDETKRLFFPDGRMVPERVAKQHFVFMSV